METEAHMDHTQAYYDTKGVVEEILASNDKTEEAMILCSQKMDDCERVVKLAGMEARTAETKIKMKIAAWKEILDDLSELKLCVARHFKRNFVMDIQKNDLDFERRVSNCIRTAEDSQINAHAASLSLRQQRDGLRRNDRQQDNLREKAEEGYSLSSAIERSQRCLSQ